MLFDLCIVAGFGISLFRFKSLLFKLLLLIVYYPFTILFLFKHGIPVVGILEVSRGNFSGTMLAYAFYAYATGLFFFVRALYPLRNEVYQYATLRLPFLLQSMLLVLCWLSSFLIAAARNGGAFGTGTFYLILQALLLLSKRPFGSVLTLAQLGIAFNTILAGERVDSLLVVLLIVVLNGKRIMKENINKILFYVGCFCFFVFAFLISFTRGGGYQQNFYLALSENIASIYAVPTICDVVYIYLTSVSYVFEIGRDSSVLLNWLVAFFPGALGSPYNYTNFLNGYMSNPGGGLFITEGMLALGFVGVPLYMYMMAKVYGFLFRQRNYVGSCLFLLFMIMACRIFWYGLAYVYKPAMLVAVVVFVLNQLKMKYPWEKMVVKNSSDTKLS